VTGAVQRFFLDGATPGADGRIDLSPLCHQLTHVLRLRPGAELAVLDNRGHGWRVQLEALDRRAACGLILAPLAEAPEPGVRVALYQCALKADKLEWVWQKATELGAATLTPVVSSRSVVRDRAALDKKRPRWQAIVREAAEQCGRGRLPVMQPASDLAAVVQGAAGLRLMPWEGAGPSGVRMGLLDVLAAAGELPMHVSLLIGPEGGFAEEEAHLARAAGWRWVTLGPRILRAETAVLTSVSLVMGAYGELGGVARVGAPTAGEFDAG
jgi:16S rRNA (uracil1498-N3)-methyltransferase